MNRTLARSHVKKSFNFRSILMVMYFGGFVADVFFVKRKNIYTDWESDVRLFLLVFLWIFMKKVYNFTSVITFKLTGLFLAFFSFFFIFFRDHPSVERLASWVYVYLVIGVIQQLLEATRFPLRDRSAG